MFQIAALALASISIPGFFAIRHYTKQPICIDRLCVLYDAGETTALLPILEVWEKEGKSFKVLVTGTAETIIKPGMFLGKRITFKDIGISEIVDIQTPRTTPLSAKSVQKLSQICPKVTLTGTASKIQQQVLEFFSSSTTVAYIDNFHYDIKFESFKTVEKVQAVAKNVLCPSQHLADLFTKKAKTAKYHIVGKPSLEVWEKEIKAVDQTTVKAALELPNDGKPLITFIGGYGPGYEIINPLFDEYSAKLRKQGYHVWIQPHPKIAAQKIKTIEALAISDIVIGYNSSVIFDAALIGKNALYLASEGAPFSHFAIDQELLTQVRTLDELLLYLNSPRPIKNLRQVLNIPNNSIYKINLLIEKLISLDSVAL